MEGRPSVSYESESEAGGWGHGAGEMPGGFVGGGLLADVVKGVGGGVEGWSQGDEFERDGEHSEGTKTGTR